MKNTDKGNIGQLIAKEKSESEERNLDSSSTEEEGEKFNKKFDKAKDEAKRKSLAAAQKRLGEMNKPVEVVPIYKQSISEILVGIKDTWFGLFSDLASFELDDILTKNHRIFYIGLTFIIIGVLLYLYEEFYSKIELANEDIDASDFRRELSLSHKKDLAILKEDMHDHIESVINSALRKHVKSTPNTSVIDQLGLAGEDVTKDVTKDTGSAKTDGLWNRLFGKND